MAIGTAAVRVGPSNGCGCDKGYARQGRKGGSVEQASGADADSEATNSNHSSQGVSQDQANHQTQTGAAGKGHKGDDCGCKDGANTAPARSRQSNAVEYGLELDHPVRGLEAFALNKAPNVAIGNGGG